jgi:hypothetical protein
VATAVVIADRFKKRQRPIFLFMNAFLAYFSCMLFLHTFLIIIGVMIFRQSFGSIWSLQDFFWVCQALSRLPEPFRRFALWASSVTSELAVDTTIEAVLASSWANASVIGAQPIFVGDKKQVKKKNRGVFFFTCTSRLVFL